MTRVRDFYHTSQSECNIIKSFIPYLPFFKFLVVSGLLDADAAGNFPDNPRPSFSKSICRLLIHVSRIAFLRPFKSASFFNVSRDGLLVWDFICSFFFELVAPG
ncbi:hypothetical protein HMI55_006134 [Coelomomyces lativittatus]|nr:hypothetical protein HMI55_006134 [Coelomomyces lativittatus]